MHFSVEQNSDVIAGLVVLTDRNFCCNCLIKFRHFGVVQVISQPVFFAPCPQAGGGGHQMLLLLEKVELARFGQCLLALQYVKKCADDVFPFVSV